MMFMYLLASGKVALYLHPKMNGYLVFALVMLIIINAYWIATALNREARKGAFKWGTMMFFLPIILFLGSPSQISNAVIQNKSIGVKMPTAVSQPIETMDEKEQSSDTSETVQKTPEEIMAEMELTPPPGADIDDAPAVTDRESTEVEEIQTSEPVKDTSTEEAVEKVSTTSTSNSDSIFVDEMYDFIVDVFEHPDLYENKTVTVEGFVYTEEGYSQDSLILSRLVMSCCAADSYVMGVFVKYGGASQLNDGDWYRMTGVMEMDAIKNPYTEEYEMILTLKPQQVESIEPYANPYIYAYETGE